MSQRRFELKVEPEAWPLREPFRTSNHTFENVVVIVVALERAGCCGRGEAAGIYYRGETVACMIRDIETARADIEAGITHEGLLELLPAGGARNALDCALWDLEARLTGKPVWELAGLPEPRPLPTFVTCGAAAPQAMARTAEEYHGVSAIKLKLMGDVDDEVRVQSVRAARPDVILSVDANQAFAPESLHRILPTLEEARVQLIEQPFPSGMGTWLDRARCNIPLMADESVQTTADLPSAVGRFDVVNVKLDKTGGLTGALRLIREARALGMQVYVGNMFGTSLAIAPAFLLAQICDFVEIDGPLFLIKDRDHALRYRGSLVECDQRLWGWASSET